MRQLRVRAMCMVGGILLVFGIWGGSSVQGSAPAWAPALPPRPTLTPIPRPTGAPGAEPAFVTVVQRPMPNLAAQRSNVDVGVSSANVRQRQANDGIVEYEIEAVNRGAGAASDTVITLPFDPAEVRVLDARFSRAGAYVRQLLASTLEIRTGPLSANGDMITATVRLLTRPTAREGASLGQRLVYRWSDAQNGGTERSNLPILVVAGSDTNRPVYPLAVIPLRGPAGSKHVFTSSIFAPGEPVTLWYNTPTGTVVAVGQLAADRDGGIKQELMTGGVASGSYSMVAHGLWTGFTAVSAFHVE